MSFASEIRSNRGCSSKLAHLRFVVQNALFASSAIGLLIGGVWVWAPFVIATALVNIVDGTFGADRGEDLFPPTAMHSAMLPVSAVLLAFNATLFAYHFTSGDPLGLVALLNQFGVDFNAARSSTSTLDLLLAIVAQGFNYSVAMSTSHELLHCTTSPARMLSARWIAALVGNPWFAIHHVHRHHRFVGLPADVGTARRGDSVYAFLARTVPSNAKFASDYERDRCAKRGVSYWSWNNRFLNGWAILAAIAGFFALVGGLKGLLAFALSAAAGRLFQESTDFIQHYGLMRVEGEPIDARLSWDVYNYGTNALLNDIGRHADHHDRPLVPSVALKVCPGAPELHYGYMTLIGMTLIPPLFQKVIKPKLDEWDRRFATDADLAFMRANGIPCAER